MRKYAVAVLDDESGELKRIVAETEAILKEEGIDYTIQAFDNEAGLMGAVRYLPGMFDLILLDILLPEDNGVGTAVRLRENGVDSTIIFLTKSPDFAIKGYEVNAFRYLLKPVRRDELRSAIRSDYSRRGEQTEILFRIGTEARRVAAYDIYSITSLGRGVLVRLKDEMFTVPQKISDIADRLTGGLLVRCHRSCIVNVAHIDHIRRYEASIKIKTNVPISKQYYDEVKRAMLTYNTE